MSARVQVTAVKDTEEVALRVSGLPVVNRGMSRQLLIIPERITLTFTRIDVGIGDDYALERIVVEGPRPKADGTPGLNRSEASFHMGSVLADETPQWLVKLADRFRPSGPKTAICSAGDIDLIDDIEVAG